MRKKSNLIHPDDENISNHQQKNFNENKTQCQINGEKRLPLNSSHPVESSTYEYDKYSIRSGQVDNSSQTSIIRKFKYWFNNMVRV